LSEFSSQNELYVVLHRLFDLFDRNNDGNIDVREFYTGISLLSSGTPEEKVTLAFEAYDADGDGFISLSEMIAYFTSFFTICCDMSEDVKVSLGHATPQQTAIATAQRCFTEADTDKDEKISFREFQQWFNNGNSTQRFSPIKAATYPQSQLNIHRNSSSHHRGRSFSDITSFHNQQVLNYRRSMVPHHGLVSQTNWNASLEPHSDLPPMLENNIPADRENDDESVTDEDLTDDDEDDEDEDESDTSNDSEEDYQLRNLGIS
jgi:Ca2+-binding EF-hand superfamily protein